MKKPKTKHTKKKKPAAKRKRKVVSCAGRTKPKGHPPGGRPLPKAPGTAAVPRPRSTAAVLRSELEAIPSRPLFDAPSTPCFLGGGTAMPAGFLPDGFVLASK